MAALQVSEPYLAEPGEAREHDERVVGAVHRAAAADRLGEHVQRAGAPRVRERDVDPLVAEVELPAGSEGELSHGG